MTHDRRELIRRLLQVSHRPRLVLRVAGGISAFLFACGVMDASGNAAVAHEEDTEITDPEEGAQFDLDEDVTVKIHGKPNTNYTITRF